MEKVDIKSLTKEELQNEMLAMGEKKFRADQIYDWMHKKAAAGFAQMSNLPKSLQRRCEEHFDYVCLDALQVQKSKHDGTQKFLFALSDHNVVESVFMPYHHGNSVCISSQVGCRMGCSFCASTLDGLTRNLRPSEMLDQIYRIGALTGERISGVVVMGTGEPLDNYDNLLRFIRLLTDADGFHLGARSITVSTCGLVPEIRRLAEEKLQITLALSLHAASDEKRRQLMPVAKTCSVAELMAAADFYYEKTGRRITLEYSLVAGVNDTAEDAERLAALTRGRNCHINLIPVNPVRERHCQRPERADVLAFRDRLEKHRVNVTIRREMGADIDGACGQLRKRYLEQSGSDKSNYRSGEPE